MRHTFIPAAVLMIALAGSARAQTGPALLLRPLMDKDEIWESGGGGTGFASGHADGADFDMSMLEWSGRVREWGPRYAPRIGWDLTHYVLESDIPVLDQNLTDVAIAGGLELGTYYDWRAGFTAGVGYAGNAPLGEGDAWYGKATLALGRQINKRITLDLVLDYDGNRSIFPDIPLPGFAWRHQFDPRLSYTIGIPLTSITWRPDDRNTIEIIWALVEQLDIRLTHKLSPKWSLVGLLERRQDAFSVDDIPDHDRLLFQQRRAEVGLFWKPLEHTTLLFAAGYAFGGEFSIGYDQRDSAEVADLSDEPYLRLAFERRF